MKIGEKPIAPFKVWKYHGYVHVYLKIPPEQSGQIFPELYM